MDRFSHNKEASFLKTVVAVGLSRPWHGPFRVTSIKGPDVEASNVYFPQDYLILIHHLHVKACPPNFPGGFYWYGGYT